MKAHICETLGELNILLESIPRDARAKIKFNSHVVGARKDINGQENYVIVDRFLVLIDENEYSTEDKRTTKKG